MEFTILLLGGLLVGGCLGLLGSGGSILTVPVLVYLLGHDPGHAIAESLAIVGAIAAVGAIGPIRRGQVDWRSVIFFGVPAMFGTAGGAWLGGVVSPVVQLTTFAGVMIAAAVMMLRSGRRSGRKAGHAAGIDAAIETETGADRDMEPGMASGASSGRRPGRRGPPALIVLEGVGVGILTGFVGVGGGFLVVPALVMLGGLSMSVAVGTSLVIIAIKSGSGFGEYLHQMEHSVDWVAIGVFSGIGAVGTVAGATFGRRLDERVLKRTFAIVVLLMGLAILTVELGSRAGGGGEGDPATDAPTDPVVRAPDLGTADASAAAPSS